MHSGRTSTPSSDTLSSALLSHRKLESFYVSVDEVLLAVARKPATPSSAAFYAESLSPNHVAADSNMMLSPASKKMQRQGSRARVSRKPVIALLSLAATFLLLRQAYIKSTSSGLEESLALYDQLMTMTGRASPLVQARREGLSSRRQQHAKHAKAQNQQQLQQDTIEVGHPQGQQYPPDSLHNRFEDDGRNRESRENLVVPDTAPQSEEGEVPRLGSRLQQSQDPSASPNEDGTNFLQIRKGPVRLCPECDCKVAGSFAASSAFTTPVPGLEALRSFIDRTGSFHTPAILRYLLHHVLLSSTLDGLFLRDEAISWLLTQHFTCPDALISYNFHGLVLDRPTSYIYTRTGPGGKLSEWSVRAPYMQRHVDVMHDYRNLVALEGFLDGARKEDRQLVWIVVEDDGIMEPGLDQLLRNSGIPYIYFAHGPTNHYGKAQWNIVMRAIEVLRDGFFGDGPVLNLDDDCRIVPELLRKIWKVEKAVVWQVGNYPCTKFDSWWEGPIFEAGKIVDWQYAWLPNRVFPIDMNGFAINSSQIGPHKPISPPQYIPFDRSAGETEFLEKIYRSRTEIEPLCEDTRAENCYYAWHNSWIRKDWHDHEDGA